MGAIALAVAGAAIAGGGAALGGAASAKAGKKAAEAQDAQRQWEFEQQQGAAKWQDEFNARMFAHLQDLPNITKLNLGPATAGLKQFMAQKKYLPGLEDMAGKMNVGYRKEVEKVAPGFEAAFANTAKNAEAWSKGEIDPDVQEAVRRAAAEGALSTGIAVESGMYKNRVARDFGLTSMDLKARAAAMIPMISSTAAQLAPYRGSQFVMSPQYLQERSDQMGMTNWQVENQNLEREYTRNTPLPPKYAKYMTAPPNVGYTGPSASSMALSAGMQAFGGALTGIGMQGMKSGGAPATAGGTTAGAAPPTGGGYSPYAYTSWNPNTGSRFTAAPNAAF